MNNKTDAEKFQEINRKDVLGHDDDEIHQKIQLMKQQQFLQAKCFALTFN